MATFVYAWELGDNLGHVGPFLPVARLLRERGHEVRCVLPAISQARQLIAAEGLHFDEVPPVLEGLSVKRDSFSDILLSAGFHSEAELGRRVAEWLPLLRGADVLLADFAPTALLAARILNIPVMLLLSSFGSPVVGRPQTPMLSDAPPSTGLEGDRLVLAAVNKVLASHGAPLVAHLPDLYAVAERRVLAIPSLDTFRRPVEDCWGIDVAAASIGADSVASMRGNRRCYAYLRKAMPWQQVLTALRRTASDALVFAPELTDAEVARFSAPNVRITRQPLSLPAVVAQVDLAITYGNSTTTATFLAGGVPVFVCPIYREQEMTGERIVEQGLGLMHVPGQDPRGMAHQLSTLLSDERYSVATAAWAAENAAWMQPGLAVRLADRAEALVPKKGWLARMLGR